MLELPVAVLGLAATSFALGARHGLDWDHVAAITDLTAPRDDDDRPARRGPGPVVLVLPGPRPGARPLRPAGAGAGRRAARRAWTRSSSTPWAPRWSSWGGWCSTSSGATAAEYRYAGRVALVVGAVRRGWARVRRREAARDGPRRRRPPRGVPGRTAARHRRRDAHAGRPVRQRRRVRVQRHGRGHPRGVRRWAWSSPTSAVAGVWVSGLLGARRAPRVQIGLGLVTGLASLVLGSLILSGYGGLVPPLVSS